MSFDTPSPAFSSTVVDHNPVHNVQSGGQGERTKLPVGKYVPLHGATHFSELPGDRHIAVALAPSQPIKSEERRRERV